MRKQEVELIAALVEGKLEDESSARALIASSEKHQIEYEAQRTAYEALSSIPSAPLTEHETAALHRDVWTELQRQPLAAASRNPWYYRWSYAAAGLFVVVGLFVVIDQTNPDFAPTALVGSDDSSTETITETATGLDGALADSTTDSTISTADRGAAEESGGAASQFAAPNVAGLAALAEQTRRGDLKSADLAATNFEQTMVDDMTQCIESAGLDNHVVVGDVEVENHYIVAVPNDIELGPDTAVSFVDAGVCELVFTDQ